MFLFPVFFNSLRTDDESIENLPHVMLACSVNGKRRERGGSPTDEVCAQKAGWQWGDGVSRMHCSLRLPYPPTHLRLLTCCWVTGGRRHHLPLPTRSTGLWRRCRFCGKNGTVSYWDCSKHCGPSQGQRGQIPTFYTSRVVHTGQGEALSHRWRMQHTESCWLCPAACP